MQHYLFHGIAPRRALTLIICLGALACGGPRLAREGSPQVKRAAVKSAVGQVSPALVRIHVVDAHYSEGRSLKNEASGSGVIISPDGYVVTNHHVAGDAIRIFCTMATREEIPAELLKAEIDTYWIQAGGGSPTAWLKATAGRIPIIHFKDMAFRDGQAVFAEIGEGNLDWPSIIAASQSGGCEYAFIEQDDCYDRTPLESLAISYRNLKAMGLS